MIVYMVSVLVAIVSYFLFKKVSGSMAINRLNIASVIFYSSLIMSSYVGAIFIANGYVQNPVLDKVSDETLIFGWLAISYVMIAFPIGMLLVKFLFRIKNLNNVFNQYTYKSLEPILTIQDSYVKFFLYLLSFLSFLSALYMVYIVGRVPQLGFFNLSTHTDILLSRSNINRSFDGIYAIKSIFFEQLTPMLSLISYGYYKLSGSFKDKFWFYCMFFLSIFMLTFSLSKSPLVGYGIIFMLLKIYIDGYIKWKYYIFFIILMFSLLIIMFFLVAKDMDIEFIFTYLFQRIFFDQISGVFLMFEIFPKYYKHIGFSSLSEPLSTLFIGSYSEPATRIAMEYAFPSAVEAGLMNLLSTLFIGEAWANFGWFGLVFSPLYLGVVIGFFYYFILISKKTPIMLAFLAYYSFGTNFGGQFNQFIYNPVFLALLFFFTSSIVMAYMLKYLQTHNKKKSYKY